MEQFSQPSKEYLDASVVFSNALNNKKLSQEQLLEELIKLEETIGDSKANSANFENTGSFGETCVKKCSVLFIPSSHIAILPYISLVIPTLLDFFIICCNWYRSHRTV